MENLPKGELEFAKRLMQLIEEAGEAYDQALASDDVDILALPERDTFVYEYLLKYCTARLVPAAYRAH